MDKVFDIFAYLMGKQAGGGGGDITVVSKSISTNGTYTAPSGKAYSPVTVDVPNSYAAGDEGKVVSNGQLVAQGSDSVTQNGTVDTTLINSLTVNVSGGGGVTLAPMDYSVTIQNARTGSITVVRVQYNLTTLINSTSASITSESSATYSGMLTDGTHFWFRASSCTNCKYNGANATYTRDGNAFQVEIPAGFDGTIPFVVS